MAASQQGLQQNAITRSRCACVLDCGGKRSATPLSPAPGDCQNSDVRSPLESTGALKDLMES